MNIDFYFKNLNLSPSCKIFINHKEKYTGIVQEKISISDDTTGKIQIEIEFIDKQPEDTIVDHQGNIVADKNFELDQIIVDGYSLNELIWDSQYTSVNGDVFVSCLFFGPAGKFQINLENPILPWLLKTRNDKYNNDPNWEEDYNYYITACNLLTQIYQK
jgi:hypothetical protein